MRFNEVALPAVAAVSQIGLARGSGWGRVSLAIRLSCPGLDNIGGSDYEEGLGIALDGVGYAYVVGPTASSGSAGFPVAVGPDLTYNGGTHDVFVAKVGVESGFSIYLPLVMKNYP